MLNLSASATLFPTFMCLTAEPESLLSCGLDDGGGSGGGDASLCVRAVFFKVQIQVVLCVQSIYRLESTVLHLLVERRPTRCPASRWSLHHCTQPPQILPLFTTFTLPVCGCISFTHINTHTCFASLAIATLNVDPRQSKQGHTTVWGWVSFSDVFTHWQQCKFNLDSKWAVF